MNDEESDEPKPKYTTEELEEYKQVFALFDTDGSGAIGTDELGEAMRSMGMNPTPQELQTLIKEIDVDGNGEIDFDEFCTVLKRMTAKKETDEEVIRSCFAVFDQDRNGIISEVEFKTVFREIGGFTEDKIDEIFREVDVAGNGQIDYEEFSQMVRNYLFDDDNDKSVNENQMSVND
uniref:EF-hand domain-containing protein n=1 Tax=Romanomermis culicivorax TaxID=13658 RepID=A0A915K2N1_ROMCU